MSTRGFLGFLADGRETITYVHHDAYPSGLGADALAWARGVTDWDTVRKQAAELVHIDADVRPTPEQYTALAQYADPTVGAKDKPEPEEEWYRLLRRTLGDPAASLAGGHAAHNPDWPGDSLWCEWGYLIDCDERRFEVYAGLQTAPRAGRFAGRATNPRSGYHAVKLLVSWPLDGLPDDDEFGRLGDGDLTL
ncbi:hypothetical protein AB0D49_08460 [Streptomyces sp. NPDC048290]|uniref:hypothetical protein n=1 Tax=Streptomyces sp. NPDC048290 TaxID=3155811 RepID=UPI003431212A